MTGTCVFCGSVCRVHLHHPTRRAGRGGAYLDAGFTVPLCAACHADVHQVLRVAALDWPAAAVYPLAYRLRTFAMHVALFGAQDVAFPIVPSAASAVDGLLREASDAVDGARSTRAGAA